MSTVLTEKSVLVCYIKECISESIRSAISEKLQEAFPGIKILILDGGATLEAFDNNS